MDVQTQNGVVDIEVADDIEAVSIAKQYLSYFQGTTPQWDAADQLRLAMTGKPVPFPEHPSSSGSPRNAGQTSPAPSARPTMIRWRKSAPMVLFFSPHVPDDSRWALGRLSTQNTP
jgi:hypothetical protein